MPASINIIAACLSMLVCLCEAGAVLPGGRRGLQQVFKDSEIWLDIHQGYVNQVQEAVGKSYDLFVFGDSIQEAWRGTGFGSRVGSRQENKRAWKKLVTPGGGYNSIVMGISGDRAEHVLWRMQNGEFPTDATPKVVEVMIGANDVLKANRTLLKAGELQTVADDIAAQIKRVMDEAVLRSPTSVLVVLGLLPLQPDAGRYAEVVATYQPVVDMINQRLQQFVGEMAASSALVQYKDCGEQFLIPGTRTLNMTLVPGGIHPTGQAAWMFAECQLRALRVGMRAYRRALAARGGQ